MADLIDRQAAVEVFCSACGLNFPNCDMCRSGKYRYWICAVPALWELPTTQPEPRWISVTERLPEPPSFCLVTTDGSHNDVIDIALFMPDGWHKASTILAWMPLPKPYERSEDE